jgi:hypothetical protein
MAYESEAFESEGYESEAFEWSEAAKKKLPKTASGKGLGPTPPPSKNFVTFTDLRSATDKIGTQLKTNADAITAVGAKLNTTTANLRKEFDERKKENDALKKDVNNKVSTLALLGLLVPPPTYTVPANTFGNTSPVQLAPPQTSMLNALLPVMLVGGLGGSGSGGLSLGGDGGMDGTMMLALALVLSQPH